MSRYLADLSLAEIAALPDKANIPVLILTGAVEQHGPHLPVGVDAMLSQAWLERLIPHLPDDLQCFAAPPIAIGKSNEHVGFPGTLAISKTTLRRLIWAQARQLHAWGFRRLRGLNTHGGQIQVVRYTFAEIQAELGMDAQVLSARTEWDVSEQEATYGFHAGELESSWVMEVLDEQFVAMDQAVCAFPASIEDPGELRPECAPAIFSWATADLSPTGVMGDATKATREKGRTGVAAHAKNLAQALVALQSTPLPQ